MWRLAQCPRLWTPPSLSHSWRGYSADTESGHTAYRQRPTVWLTHEFKAFSNDWHFEHLTSSPGYPQSNGEVDRAVQNMEMILKKTSDEYLALLTNRETPLHHCYSPAQLSMGRKLHTRVPCHPGELKPMTPWLRSYRKKGSTTQKWNLTMNVDTA